MRSKNKIDLKNETFRVKMKINLDPLAHKIKMPTWHEPNGYYIGNTLLSLPITCFPGPYLSSNALLSSQIG